MGTYSDKGKAQFRAVLTRKLGCSDDALARFVRRAKEKFSRKADAIGQIKAYMRDGDVAAAKKLCLSRLNDKIGLDEKTVGNHIGRLKGKTATKSMTGFKDQLRPHLG